MRRVLDDHFCNAGVVWSRLRTGTPACRARRVSSPFETWLEGVRTEALARGIRSEVVERAFADVQPVAQIVERDRSQAEFAFDLDTYLKRRLTRETVRMADRMFYSIARCSRKWGSVRRPASHPRGDLGARIQLRQVCRRAPDDSDARDARLRSPAGPLFREELFQALEILNAGHVEADRLKGSWAGAIGQPQFMPSTYLKYAQDFDGDGKRDIWTSPGGRLA